MPTLVLDPPPVEFEALLKRRQELGQGVMDEVWEGVYVMNPAPAPRHAYIAQQLAELLGPAARAAALVPMLSAFNLGDPADYRVPDGGLLRQQPPAEVVYVPSAALAVEVVSPDDRTWEKLEFYAAHGVEELLIVDPQGKTVSWMGLERGEYKHLKRSRLIKLGPAELAEQLDWP